VTPTLGFEPRVRFDGPVDTIVGTALALHLLAALRELLSNLARHARATAVEVRVPAGLDVTLTVTDNGDGRGDHGSGDGIVNLLERATSLGGFFTLQPGEAADTVAVWSVPRDKRAGGSSVRSGS
jgi:two-component system, NarL family, sensor histidine kinase DevS